MSIRQSQADLFWKPCPSSPRVTHSGVPQVQRQQAQKDHLAFAERVLRFILHSAATKQKLL